MSGKRKHLGESRVLERDEIRKSNSSSCQVSRSRMTENVEIAFSGRIKVDRYWRRIGRSFSLRWQKKKKRERETRTWSTISWKTLLHGIRNEAWCVWSNRVRRQTTLSSIFFPSPIWFLFLQDTRKDPRRGRRRGKINKNPKPLERGGQKRLLLVYFLTSTRRTMRDVFLLLPRKVRRQRRFPSEYIFHWDIYSTKRQ